MSLEAQLKKRAQQWATEITNKAKANLGDKVRLIHVQSKTKSVRNGVVEIEVTGSNKTSNRWGIVNVARAYEQGSGIHGRRKRTYVIKPRSKGLLVFYWQKLNMHVALPRVNHPGVQAVNNGKGYIRPAVRSVRPKINRELRKMMGDEGKASIRKAFANK
jgi:hypothetical protein